MSSLEINIDTRDFVHLQTTLAQMSTKELDKLLRSTVNAVGVKVDKMIRQQVANELGVSESVIRNRLILNKSDSRPHTVRSAWIWIGTERLMNRQKERRLQSQWVKTKVRIGKYLTRDGFQKTNQSISSSLKVSEATQQVLQRVVPILPTWLEQELEVRLSKYLVI